MPARIEDYALIGDCETAALVSNQGSIDWLCWPTFASPACMAALLGDQENGHWCIAPAQEGRSSRKYRDGTLIVETTFENGEGSVLLIDFMPIRGKYSDLVRIVRGLRGKVRMCMELVLRFDYGRAIPWVTRLEDATMRAISGPDMVVLRTDAPLRGENMKTVSEFTLSKGESMSFVLTYAPSYGDLPKPIHPEHELKLTTDFWTDWSSKVTSENSEHRYEGDYTEAVRRSLITLKALTYAPTGGMVAAPTTSLPERLGGQRNWDYRFCWLRDATFTLLALMNAGYYEEAGAWRDWLLRAAAGSPDQVQIMYGIRGERHLLEWEVDWLAGYEGSKPVRVGNAASSQLQLDVYGEVADALLHAELAGLPSRKTDLDLQDCLTEHLAKIWHEPDEGIWEVRSGPKQFTYSKVMVWVAFDRAIKYAERCGRNGQLKQWREIRETIHRDVCEKGFDSELNSFTQTYGSKRLDASLLLMPLVGFLPVEDERVRGTIVAIEKHLMRDGLVQRYDTDELDDGVKGQEGSFLACSFWLVSAWNMCGRRKEARELFERLLSLRNDVGLLSEEYDTIARRQVGNFPQALSHIALVNSALEFTRGTSPGEQRAQSKSALGEY
ncbi:MAG: glycoside hydrolase family 15 protein [Candidatus Korobacteraceae bacterium]